MTDLLPCPFCGADVRPYEVGDGAEVVGFAISCVSNIDGHAIRFYGETESSACEQWNRLAAASVCMDMVEEACDTTPNDRLAPRVLAIVEELHRLQRAASAAGKEGTKLLRIGVRPCKCCNPPLFQVTRDGCWVGSIRQPSPSRPSWHWFDPDYICTGRAPSLHLAARALLRASGGR